MTAKIAFRSSFAAFTVLALVIAIALAIGSASGRENRQERGAAAADELLPPEAFASIADPAERSAAVFTEAGKVFTHPRCVNCHAEGDRPLQGDDSHPHQPWARRGADGFGAPGMRCATCHTDENFDPAGVPGAPNWHLAPTEMTWQGKSIGEICDQVKDPARNGDRTLQDLIHHAGEDPLVTWAWSPGRDRQPAPGTQTVFRDLIQAWIDDGAVCPP
ncbi:MAG: Isoquinoline 1-oxidoreductase subunit [Proteobacteria bacterium]|nr:Isoquinoline 1-oxidoreductase subunit [Pseudomonadota bacterium]